MFNSIWQKRRLFDSYLFNKKLRDFDGFNYNLTYDQMDKKEYCLLEKVYKT